MQKKIVLIGVTFAFLSVALGAFGAHSLESTLVANEREDTFKTATDYLMTHGLALLLAAWLATHYEPKRVYRSALALAFGAGIFSGSLIVLAVFDIGIFGAVAPVGGIFMLLGWLGIGFAAWQTKKQDA